jgi:hypothetical protein
MLQRVVAVLLASAYLAVAASQTSTLGSYQSGLMRMLPGGGRSQLVIPEQLDITARQPSSQQRQPQGLAQTPAQRAPARVLPGGGRGHLVEDTTTKTADAHVGAQAAGQDLNPKHLMPATSRHGGRRMHAAAAVSGAALWVTQQQEYQEPQQLQGSGQALPSRRSLRMLERARQG